MGREEKRQRERTVRQLERRLRRKPTDEEVEKALAEMRESRRRAAGRGPAESLRGRQPR